MAFAQKIITVSLSLANGQFEGGGNTAELTGLRITALISATGGVSQSTMEMSIYGLPLSMMNQLSTIGTQANQRSKNSIQVMAGDASTGMSLVFKGVIYNAFVDAQAMPDVAFRITATPGVFHAVKPLAPVSVNGSADAAQLMQQIAGQMELGFEHNGVNTKLASPYYDGTAWQRMTEIAQHGNFDAVVDRGTLVISPRGTPRQGDTVAVDAQHGMVGYPAFVENRIIVKTLFNPAIKLLGKIKVTSTLTPANGTWQVYKIDYELESQMPHGRWFQVIEANPLGTT